MVDVVPGIQILGAIICIHVLASSTDDPKRKSSLTVIVLSREIAVVTKTMKVIFTFDL